MDLLYTIVITLATIAILVAVHEWGHFCVARRCGVKVLRFSIGFGKALYTRVDRYGTEFSVAAIIEGTVKTPPRACIFYSLVALPWGSFP